MSLQEEVAARMKQIEEEFDVDLDDIRREHLCHHQFQDGAICQMVAPAGHEYCHWHSTAADRIDRRVKYEKRRGKQAIKQLVIPCIEDQYSLQIAIHEIMDAIIDGRLDNRRAGHLLYALQISQNNIRGHFHFPRLRYTQGQLEANLVEERQAELEAARKKPVQSETGTRLAAVEEMPRSVSQD